MGVMNKSVHKDGLGWTRRNWEKPEVRRLKWHEWSPAYIQKVYFGVTRTAFVIGSTAALFIFGKIFIPFSQSTMRQSKTTDYMGVADPDMKDNLRRRYGKTDGNSDGKSASVKSEVDRMVDTWAPESVSNFKERLDSFIRRTADRFLGEDRKNPERDLYAKLKNDQEKIADNT